MTYKETVKMMKKIFEGIRDNEVQILETLLLVFCVVFPFIANISELFKDYLEQTILTPQNLISYLAIKKGEYVAAIILFFLAFLKIRKYNKEFVMNQKNIYHNYPLAWYYYCAKMLGIKKCNLVLVPIYMQFQLVIQNVFDEFPLDEKDYPVLNDESNCSVSEINQTDNNSEINLILEDTYLVNEKQLPFEKRKLPTIKVSRNDGQSMERHFSQKFVKAIINEVRKLPEGVHVNVYATTNPMNTMYIAKRVFKIADRGNVKHLYVFQQKKTKRRNFESKGIKIY